MYIFSTIRYLAYLIFHAKLKCWGFKGVRGLIIGLLEGDISPVR